MRIVILTYESFFSNLMTERLLDQFPGQVVGIVRSGCLIHGKSLAAGLSYLRQRAGLRFVVRKTLEESQRRLAAFIFKLTGRQPRVHALRELRALHAVPVIRSADVNDPGTLAHIRAWQPDLVISIYLNQLIRRPLIALPPRGVINIHPALLPRHRGVFPYFWVIAAGETETGATVHWVDEGYDTGRILLQRRMAVAPDDSVLRLAYKCALLGADLLVQAVNLIAAGNPPRLPQDDSRASYHSWPTPADQRRFARSGGRYGTILGLWKHL